MPLPPEGKIWTPDTVVTPWGAAINLCDVIKQGYDYNDFYEARLSNDCKMHNQEVKNSFFTEDNLLKLGFQPHDVDIILGKKTKEEVYILKELAEEGKTMKHHKDKGWPAYQVRNHEKYQKAEVSDFIEGGYTPTDLSFSKAKDSDLEKRLRFTCKDFFDFGKKLAQKGPDELRGISIDKASIDKAWQLTVSPPRTGNI